MSDVLDKWELVKTMRLSGQFEGALRKLREEVTHQRFQKSLETWWKRGKDGNVAPESICWFFCWGDSGGNSSRTADSCKALWNEVFATGYNYRWFKHNISIDFARAYRYRPPAPEL